MATGVIATLAAAAFLRSRPARGGDPGTVDRMLRLWASAWLRAAGARVTVQGVENIEPGKAYLVVCNHQSNLDSMALLQALPLPLRILAKAEMFRIRVLGAAMRAAGMVEVDRRSPDFRQIDDDAARTLSAGQSLLVYPEGTTSADATIGDFKDGAFILAIANQVPVLPVALEGTARIWPPGGLAVHRGQVRVSICRPVPVTGLASPDARQLRDRLQQAVIAAHRDLADGYCND
jgi:1-acyl-sn-glycerol-3-phosphate acyltransferase